MDDDRLSIGRFARLSGLSIGALRHYDELDLLRPAEVDVETGYRRYRRDQLPTARAIARLRELEVPLEEVRSILADDDPAGRRAIVERSRRRIEARSARLGRVLHHLHLLSTGKEPIVPDTAVEPEADELDAAAHRALGVALFNRTWALLERPNRTPEQDDELIHTAHASRHHWGHVGEPYHRARGEWQCARVYATLGRAEPALWHARRCLEILEAGGGEDWDLAAAYEGLARAHAVAGDAAAAHEWRERATAALAGIADPADREVIEQDIATLPI